MDHVSGEWGAFNEILKRKDSAVQAQVRRRDGSTSFEIVELYVCVCWSAVLVITVAVLYISVW